MSHSMIQTHVFAYCEDVYTVSIWWARLAFKNPSFNLCNPIVLAQSPSDYLPHINAHTHTHIHNVPNEEIHSNSDRFPSLFFFLLFFYIVHIVHKRIKKIHCGANSVRIKRYSDITASHQCLTAKSKVGVCTQASTSSCSPHSMVNK